MAHSVDPLVKTVRLKPDLAEPNGVVHGRRQCRADDKGAHDPDLAAILALPADQIDTVLGKQADLVAVAEVGHLVAVNLALPGREALDRARSSLRALHRREVHRLEVWPVWFDVERGDLRLRRRHLLSGRERNGLGR